MQQSINKILERGAPPAQQNASSAPAWNIQALIGIKMGQEI